MSRQFKNGKCSCWKKIDKQLREDDSCLDFSWDFSGKTYLNIATHRTDGNRRKTAKRVLASYCPFCGSKLESGEAS